MRKFYILLATLMWGIMAHAINPIFYPAYDKLTKIDPSTGSVLDSYTYPKSGSYNGYSAHSLVLYQGKFYGTTFMGGTNNAGMLYEFNPETEQYKVLYNFSNSGARYGWSSLMVTSDGVLVGTTLLNTSNNLGGIVFSYNIAQQKFTNLTTLTTSQGSYVNDGFVEASNGKFYGIGISTYGSYGGILELDLQAKTLQLKTNIYPSTERATGGILKANDGKLYFYTKSRSGSNTNNLRVFHPETQMSSTIVYSFGYAATGIGAPIQASNGNIYGITNWGGYHRGQFFELNPTSKEITFQFSFGPTYSSAAYFWDPVAKLVENTNGKIYGITQRGGAGAAFYAFDPKAKKINKIGNFEPTFVLRYDATPSAVMYCADGDCLPDVGSSIENTSLKNDSLALVKLYQSTGGANWLNNTGWLKTEVKDWYGVTVQEVDGIERVTRVILRSNNLLGTLPSDFSNEEGFDGFEELRSLNIGFNKISGSIPNTFIRLLSNATIIDLSSNSLEGDFPQEVLQLSKLERLICNHNSITSFPGLSGMTALNTLYLYSNKLTNFDFSFIPNSGGFNTRLLLHDNQISSISILNKTYQTNNLFIGLSGNKLPKSTINAMNVRIPEASINARFQEVEGQLDDKSVSYDGKGEVTFNTTNILADKYIWNYNIEGNSFEYSYSTSTPNKTLNNVENLKYVKCYTFWKLAQNVDYSNLYQQFNIIPDYGEYVRANYVDSIAMVQFYQTLKGESWKNNTNWLTGPFHTWYGITLNENGLVKEINLNNNNLTGKLPTGFSVGFLKPFTALTKFRVRSNNLTGSVPADLISLFSKLEVLDVAYNTLEGEIPTEVKNLTNLTDIDIQYCNVTSLPDEVFTLPNLESINATRNAITEFPIAALASPSLEYLGLYNNKISTIGDSNITAKSTRLSINLRLNQLPISEFNKLIEKLGSGTSIDAYSQNLPIITVNASGGENITVTIPTPTDEITSYSWYKNWTGTYAGRAYSPSFTFNNLVGNKVLVRYESNDNKYSANQLVTLEISPDFAPDFAFTTNEDQRYSFSLSSMAGNDWLSKIRQAGITSIADAKVNITKQPSHGSVGLSGTYIHYTPTRNYNGSDEIEYTISSISKPSITDKGTISITIKPVNDRPVVTLNSRYYEVEFGSTVNIPVTANDDADDPNQSPLSIFTQSSSNGTATYNPATNSIRYAPRYNSNFTDYFYVYARETTGERATSYKYLVRVKVIKTGNEIPVANNMSYSVRSGRYAYIYPNVTDKETSTYQLQRNSHFVTRPGKGYSYKSGSAFIYYPYSGQSGSTSFRYRTYDSDRAYSNTATVNLNIIGNQPPTLRNYITPIELGRDGYTTKSLYSLAYDDYNSYTTLRYYPNYYNGRYRNTYASRYVSAQRRSYRYCYTYRYWWSYYRRCYYRTNNYLTFQATSRAKATYNWYLRYYRNYSWNFGYMPYTVYDSHGAKSTGYFNITMRSWYKGAKLAQESNEELPPIFTYNDTVDVYYNQTDTIYFEALGLPGTKLTMEVTTPPTMGTLTNFAKDNEDLMTLYTGLYTPGVNTAALDSCEIKVSDDQGNTVYYWNFFNISGEPQAPVIDEIPTQVGREDEPLSISLPVSDADDLVDSLQFDLDLAIGDSTYNAFVTVENGEAILQFYPPENFSDSLMCFVTVSDKDGQSAEQNFFIYIEPVNDEPEIVVDTTFVEVTSGEPFEFLAFTLDEDEGDTAFISYDNLPAWATITDSMNDMLYITGTPQSSDAGYYSLVISADDGDAQVQTTINIVVIDANDQAPIVVNPIADVTLTKSEKGHTIDISNVFTDPDGDEISINILENSNEDWMSVYLSDDGLKMQILQDGVADATQITLEGSAMGKSAITSFFVEVPDLAPVANYQLEDLDFERTAEEYTVSIKDLFTDPDGDELDIYVGDNTFADLVTPSISGDNLTLYFNGTGGDTYLTMVAEAYGKTAEVIFKVSVKDVAPELLNSLADTVIYKNQSLNVDINGVFFDQDDENLEKTISYISDTTLAESVQVYGDQVVIEFAENKSGAVQIEVTATSNTQSISDVFTITVQDRAPVVTKAFGTEYFEMNAEPASFVLDNYFNDPDGEPLTYEIDNITNEGYGQVFIEDGVLYILFAEDLQAIGGVTINATADGKTVANSLKVMLGFGVATDDIENSASISAYPNPSGMDGWYIVLPSDQQDVVSYTLFGVNGETLQNGFANQNTFVSAKGLSPGVYLLKITGEQQTTTIPVILK